MRYIIMAGRSLTDTDLPKQLWKVCNETIIGRTIRLLKKCGVKDIAISTQDKRFEQFGLKLLKHNNPPKTKYWISCFYPTDEPACYIFGDVVFSLEAIQKIVSTQTDSIEFFASAPPFSSDYPKKWAEPFAFKVVDQKYFQECINEVRKGIALGTWRRDPLAWELWQVIKDTPRNKVDYTNYVAINDFTCDVDELNDLCYYKDKEFLNIAEDTRPHYMIHTYPGRLWYVEEYMIPSMLKQGIEESQIEVYCDEARLGNLKACMYSYLNLPDTGGTWHLQDDVLICKDFKKRTEENNRGYVAGFTKQEYGDSIFGITKLVDMPWTFPCIRIPNKVAKECADWVLNQIIGNPVYRDKWDAGVGDDWMFRFYTENFQADKFINVLKPSLVEHIDVFLGGSSVGTNRPNWVRAKYFDDTDLVEKLRKKLCKNKK